VPDQELVEASMLPVTERNVPLMTAAVNFAKALHVSRATAVLVTDTEHLGHESLREMTWQLEGTGVELLISPNVLDVSSSRLTLHDVSGMPMLQVEEPQYAGAGRMGKSIFDSIGSGLLLLAFAPILIATAVAVKVSSPGPIFYRQERVGRDGRTFRMIKFRSMRVGADAELAALLAAEGKNLAELPKLTSDPRVTRVGAFIRRFSIDELPQLLNVLKGDMSLVGPRPQRDFEVAGYDHVATRRLTVRPGITGLWQVSGRSDLAFDEAIALDVHYVENWSMTSDLIILWRTARAVVASDGAY
jgi:exopolysaccharide biosynthesis polyprenyl glycosylphosphotransferase